MRQHMNNELVHGNLREYRHKWYSAKSYIRSATFPPQKLSVYLQVNHYVMRPESYRIRWNNPKYGTLRRSRSFKVTDFGTNQKLIYDFLLVINTNYLPHILHRFRDTAFDRSKIAIFGYPSCIYPIPPDGGITLARSPQNFLWMSTDGQGTKWRRNIAENFNRLCMAHECYRRQMDGRRHIANVNNVITATFLQETTQKMR